MGRKDKKTSKLTPCHTIPPRPKELKIMARFYEPLYMLRALGQTRGAHTRQSYSANSMTLTRRRFLQNLCYICDFTCGGQSCTAIGLEECPDKFQFWISSNDQSPDIVKFLKEALKFLYSISDSVEEESAEVSSQFVQLCADFAKLRIETEQKLVQARAIECVTRLQNQITEVNGPRDRTGSNTSDTHRIDSAGLVLFLGNLIHQRDPVELCEFAHEHRQSSWMTDLRTLADGDEREMSPDAKRSSFFLVRHYIGRLSHHIRAPRQLVEDSSIMQHVLQTHTVMMVPPPAAVPSPSRDGLTTLSGIMKRMFNTYDIGKESVERGLIYINSITGLFERFLTFYGRSDNCVHAEIQVLEHFYWSRLVFAGDDRFIACSKPACLCCELYFRHHPARMIIPSSHRKVWTNWSPPMVQNCSENEDRVIHHKQIMSKVTHDVREQIISQVLQRTSQSPWHPDSRTGITESLATGLQGLSLESQPNQPSRLSDTDNDSGSRNSEVDRCSDSDDGGVPLRADDAFQSALKRAISESHSTKTLAKIFYID